MRNSTPAARPSSAVALLRRHGVLLLVTACDKVPLLAPTGTVITLFPAAKSVPVNGTMEIVVTVIENGVAATSTTPSTPTTPTTATTPGAAPTPTLTATTTTTTRPGREHRVQNGTLVSFTTTIGTIEPREARTNNGQVNVRFSALSQSGLATITAYSGGASGRIENLRVGSAAVERVLVSATPQTLGPAGGNGDFGARRRYGRSGDSRRAGHVHQRHRDAVGGNRNHRRKRLRDGDAQHVTSVQGHRKRRRENGGRERRPQYEHRHHPGRSDDAVSAGVPATFTVNVGTTANLRDVVVDFGEGSRRSLGALSGSTTIHHTYNEAGTYNVSATATEASGFTETVSTDITVLPGSRRGAIVTASNPTPTVNQTITFTATVSGATSTIQSYQWEFGDGTTAVTTGPHLEVVQHARHQVSSRHRRPGGGAVRPEPDH